MRKALELLAAWKGRLVAAFVIAAAGAIAGGAFTWWVQGNRYGVRLERVRADVAAADAAAADRYRQLERSYRVLEGDAREAVAAVSAHAQKEREIESAAAAAARAKYLAGTRRLSLAVRSCAAGPADATADAGTAVVPGEARAELAPETAAALDAIATDGDRGIRDANACIDIYNGVRGTMNGELGVKTAWTLTVRTPKVALVANGHLTTS